MVATSRPATHIQLHTLVRQRYAVVDRYFTPSDDANEYFADVHGWVDQLSIICRQPPRSASFSLYLRASTLLHCLGDFLDLMDEDLSGKFAPSDMSRIWVQASQWCQEASVVHQPLSRDQVWDWIAPAMPDTLEDLGNNIFEAKWASPVPEMDIELLRGTEGVRILSDAFEPAQMPDGVGLRFTIDT